MMNQKHILFSILVLLFLGSCSLITTKATPPPTAQPTSSPRPTQTSAPEPILNPLTGLPVADPSLLELPAVLVSISHFPVTARPQAGLSFAPYVFEVYITEGATRFLAAFYGEFPAPESPLTGGCEVRRDIFTQTDLMIGNQVWLDSNQNNVRESFERGVGGMCIHLYDINQNLLQQTTTDSNGYYGFNVSAGAYRIAMAKPPGMEFAQKDVGEEETDSDLDPVTGWSDPLDVSTSLLDLDVGLIQQPDAPSSLSPLPEAKVGPVRSGRLVYADIAASFPGSCLIFAFASPEVLSELPLCAFVSHDVEGGGYMLGIDEMTQLAHDSKKPDVNIDYSSNVYSAEPPVGGMPASELHVFIAYLNQSAWEYDPLSQSWWRFVDDARSDTAGILHPEVDKLTNRQLHFENVIVLFARHDVISPTNLDIRLDQNLTRDAIAFRDGMRYDIRWSMGMNEADLSTGVRRPIRFYYEEDETTPFPLKPGHTWILVVTPQTTVSEPSAGEWFLRFAQPEGAK